MSGMKVAFQRPDGSVVTLTGRTFEAMVRPAFGAHAWLCAPEIGESAIGHVIDCRDGSIIAEVVGCSGATAAKINSECMRRSTCLMLDKMAKKNAEGAARPLRRNPLSSRPSTPSAPGRRSSSTISASPPPWTAAT